MKREHNISVEFFFLFLLALLWGSSYLFIKVAVQDIPPITLIAGRVLGAALFLMVVMGLRSERLPRDVVTWRMLFVQAIFNSIAAWTVLAWGQQYVDAGLASVLNSTSPIFVFLFTASITRHERLGGLKMMGAAIGIAGVCLIVGLDVFGGLGSAVGGQLACLLGAALYGCAAIYGKHFSHISATATAAGTMIWASVVLVPAALLVEAPWTLSPGLKAVGAMAALSFLCTGVALLIYFRLIKTLGSLGVASQAYLRSGVGIVLGIIFLGEQLTLSVAVGLFAAILGVALINMPPKKSKT